MKRRTAAADGEYAMSPSGNPTWSVAISTHSMAFSGARRQPWLGALVSAEKGTGCRSAQAVAVHQDGIGGRGHPVEVAVFFPDQAIGS